MTTVAPRGGKGFTGLGVLSYGAAGSFLVDSSYRFLFSDVAKPSPCSLKSEGGVSLV